MSTRDLRQISIDLIRRWQHQSGAYVASPTFSQYGYSWLRDGAWIAYAMDKVGQHDSADNFYRWGVRVLEDQRPRVQALLNKLRDGEALAEEDYLPTRFTLDGKLGTEAWTDFQLDGYGTWLWGLIEHCKSTNTTLSQPTRMVIKMIVNYLEPLWRSRNYDCWEEHRTHIHTATLAALYGGLKAVQDYDPTLVPAQLPDDIRTYILNKCVAADGHFRKYDGNDEVDASLLWVSVPYCVVSVDDPRFRATFDKIVRDLYVPDSGVHRFRADNYYGGGEWLLLTAWLGWTYLEMGQRERAFPLLRWIEAQADADGQMPEQVEHHLLLPDHLQHWIAKWGTSAKPLLWSHAMYLVLDSLLNG